MITKYVILAATGNGPMVFGTSNGGAFADFEMAKARREELLAADSSGAQYVVFPISLTPEGNSHENNS